MTLVFSNFSLTFWEQDDQRIDNMRALRAGETQIIGTLTGVQTELRRRRQAKATPMADHATRETDTATTSETAAESKDA